MLAAAGLAAAGTYAAAVLAPLRLDRVPARPWYNLARAVGEDWLGLARFTVPMLILFGLYLVGLRVARGGRGQERIALGCAALFALLLIPAHPFHSGDAFHYVATARVFAVHHANPLVTPPNAFPQDPLTNAADWTWLPSPYGPLWALLSGGLVWLAGAGTTLSWNLVLLKALAGAFAVVTAWACGAVAAAVEPGSRARAVVAFGWNPLVVLHTAGDGHNDAAMLCLLSIALLLIVRGRACAGAATLALSGLVKFVTLLLTPLLVVWAARRAGIRVGAAMLFTLAATIALLYALFWEGPGTVAASLGEGAYVTASWQALAARRLDHTALEVATWVARVVALAVIATLAWRVRPATRALVASATVSYLVWLVLATPWFMPWYALWPLVTAACSPSGLSFRVTLALALGALFLPVASNFLSAISGQYANWRAFDAVALAIVWAPPLLVLVYHVAGRCARGRAGPSVRDEP